MAAPTTLLDFRTQDRDAIKQALDDTRARLAAAVIAEANATAAFTQASLELDEKRDALDNARKALAVIPMPADGAQLIADMRTAMVDWRKAGTAQVSADAQRMHARDERQRLSGAAAALGARLDAAEAALKEETDASKKRGELVATVTTGALKDLRKQADDAAKANGKPASDNVEKDFPTHNDATKSFLARVRSRRALAAAAASDAADIATSAISVSAKYDQQNPRASVKTATLQAAFDIAVDRLRAYVSAAPRVPQASAALQALAKRPSPVTAAQHAEIFADATLQGKREASLAKLAARDGAQQALAAAAAAYEKGLFAARVDSPDKTDDELKAVDPLKSLDEALKKKQGELAAAEGALTTNGPDNDVGLLQDWFAAVPDASWDELDELDAALADLGVVAGIDPANDLVKPMHDAEAALAGNLDAAAQEQRVRDRIVTELAARRSDLDDARAVAVRRTLTAARFMVEV